MAGFPEYLRTRSKIRVTTWVEVPSPLPSGALSPGEKLKVEETKSTREVGNGMSVGCTGV